MGSTVDQQRFPMVLEHAGGDRLSGAAAPRSRVTTEHANASCDGQSSVDVSNGRKKVGVHRIVAETVRGFSGGFPHALQFRPGYVFTASVPVECRLLRHTPALDHNRSYLPGKVRMTDQSNAHTGIYFSHVRLAEGDNVRLVKRPNQGPDNGVKAVGFLGQTDVRSWHSCGRLSAKQRRRKHEQRGERAERDAPYDRTLCGN